MWQKRLQKLQKLNLVKWEEYCRKYWKKHSVFEKSLKAQANAPTYTFYDGPITSNNRPHYGHALTMTLKDVLPRYKTMCGYYVNRSLGWDCQGIPVEYEVEKQLGFKEKQDIENYGVKKFNSLCRKSVKHYQKAILDLTNKMGRWVTKDEEFATMDAKYIESVWWSLKELYKKGLLYRGYKVVPYSTRAGTPLSNFEVALGGYRPITDTGITVSFYVQKLCMHLLAWTTTPWTLPGNLLLAVNKSEKYTIVTIKGDDKKYLVAKKRVESVFSKKEYKILGELEGKDLVGHDYEPLFNYFHDRKAQGAFKIVHADHVGTDEGTGIVHIAPYGEEDFEILQNLKIDLFDYLDEQGHFTKDIPEVAGQFYKNGQEKLIEVLKKSNAVFDVSEYSHEMPMCWRTDTPLIYKPLRSWYVKVTAIKDKLVEENERIKWIPDSFKEGRFGNWLRGAKDWALSRKRYWGTPIPAWICTKCQNIKVVGSFSEIEEETGRVVKDPHKPFVDAIKLKCNKCGGTMKRDPDVIDVWYDSGAMPFARLHYPFENKSLFLQKYPAEYIAEGTDQTRGWFYTLHVLGIALFGKRAFNHVIVNGMFLAADGKKLSKSKRNYTDYEILLNQFGADVMRLYFLSTPVVKAESVIFSEKQLTEMNARTVIPLVNLVKYFLLYANVHKLVNEKKSSNFFDKWLLIRLNEVTHNVNKAFSNYDLQEVVLQLINFVDDVSKWYVHANRERFVNRDLGALSTLKHVLLELSKLFAPVIPYLSELVYQNLQTENNKLYKSVHLESYPFVKMKSTDKLLLEKMDIIRTLVKLGMMIRVEKGIRLRQPLAFAFIMEGDADFVNILKSELNVKEVVLTKSKRKSIVYESEGKISLGIDTRLTNELEEEGVLRDLLRSIKHFRGSKKLSVAKTVTISIVCSERLNAITKKHTQLLKNETKTILLVSKKRNNCVYSEYTIGGEKVEFGI